MRITLVDKAGNFVVLSNMSGVVVGVDDGKDFALLKEYNNDSRIIYLTEKDKAFKEVKQAVINNA